MTFYAILEPHTADTGFWIHEIRVFGDMRNTDEILSAKDIVLILVEFVTPLCRFC